MAHAGKALSLGEPVAEVDRASTRPSPWVRLFRRVVLVEPGELPAMLLACACFFFLFSSYFILRPIRDAMAVASGVSALPWLFAGTLSAMLLANPLFSALVVRFPVRRFMAVTYQFFALNLLGFFALGQIRGGQTEVWVGRVFFTWTSVFNLFVVSVFWSFMADHFRSDQAKRLFGFIAVGGTLGSVVGSGVTAVLAHRIGPIYLLLLSAALLELAVLIVVIFPKPMPPVDKECRESRYSTPVGGSIWAGLIHVARSHYLLGIAGFLLLYTFGSTVLYFEQTDIIGRYFTSHAARTATLARMEFAVQLLTALTQAFLTGRIVRWIGVAAALAIMPAVSAIGFFAVGASGLGLLPLLGTFVVFSILRRSTNFALTNPSREALFTVVSREDKFKSKSFLDTFVYRAGDQIGAWTYGGLAALGLGVGGIAWIAVPLSVLLVALAIWLGRRQEELASALGQRAGAA